MSLEYQPGSRRQDWRDAGVILLFVALGLSFVIYPFVALADVMSLGGEHTRNVSAFFIVASRIFLYGSLAYPIVLIPCYLIGILFAVLKRTRMCIVMLIAPLAYIVLILIPPVIASLFE